MSKKDVHPIVSGAGWIGSFAGALVSELEEFGVPFEDIHKLNGNTVEGRALVRVCAERINEMVRGVPSEFLKLISSGQSLILDAVDGTETLAEAKDVFDSIDSDFKNWGADEKGPATEETAVDVYEMRKDATFSQMFGSLNSDVGELCFTQHQIKNFVKKHRGWLQTEGYATFFLFKSEDNFFVASVSFRSVDSLNVYVYRFEYSDVWYAGHRYRVVSPQLA